MSLMNSSWLKAFGVTAIVCLVTFSLSAISANAESRRKFCNNYAKEAVEQNEINDELGCEYHGSRWQSKVTPHFAWCMLFPRQAEAEHENRAKMIRKCRREARRDRRRHNREAKRANCDTYAKIAVVQAKANSKYECGYRGGEWIKRERPHFRWCLGARRAYLVDEIRYRQVQLQKCFNKLGDYDEDDQDRGYRRRRF